MSYSYSKKGTKAEVKKYLDEDAPKAMSHISGVERTIADQALGTLRAAVEAQADDPKYEIEAAANGSASFGTDGLQVGQDFCAQVKRVYKP